MDSAGDSACDSGNSCGLSSDLIQCRVCKKTFSRKSNLTSHMETHEESRKKVQCPFCVKTFTTKSNLEAHCKNAHPQSDLPLTLELTNVLIKSKENSPTCDICKKSFTRKENLLNHIIRFHTNARKKLKCKFCASTFGKKSDLVKHFRKFHKRTLENPNDTTQNEHTSSNVSYDGASDTSSDNHFEGFELSDVAMCQFAQQERLPHDEKVPCDATSDSSQNQALEKTVITT